MTSRTNHLLRAGLALFAVLLLVSACATGYCQRIITPGTGHRTPIRVQGSTPPDRVAPTSEAIRVSAQLSADPASYTGASPARIHFKGTISATGACTVKYAFVKSDSGQGNERTIVFTSAGTRPVGNTWTIAKIMSGWESIEIIAPVSVQSNKASFQVQLAGPVQPKGPGIRTPRGTTGGNPSIVGHTPITLPNRTVANPVRPGITPPTHLPSTPNHVNPSASAIQVTLFSSPNKYVGTQNPKTIHFNGAIAVSEPCSVQYVFDRSDGATMKPITLAFPKAGKKYVKDEWTLSENYAGWEQLRVISPKAATSNKAEFTVKFISPKQPSTGAPKQPPTSPTLPSLRKR